MSPEEESRRGQHARDLLNDPLIAEAFETIEHEVMDQWKKSPARDVEGREKLWLMLQMTHKIRGHLESLVASGRMADHTLAARLKNLGRTTRRG